MMMIMMMMMMMMMVMMMTMTMMMMFCAGQLSRGRNVVTIFTESTRLLLQRSAMLFALNSYTAVLLNEHTHTPIKVVLKFPFRHPTEVPFLDT